MAGLKEKNMKAAGSRVLPRTKKTLEKGNAIGNWEKKERREVEITKEKSNNLNCP